MVHLFPKEFGPWAPQGDRKMGDFERRHEMTKVNAILIGRLDCARKWAESKFSDQSTIMNLHECVKEDLLNHFEDIDDENEAYHAWGWFECCGVDAQVALDATEARDGDMSKEFGGIYVPINL